MERKIGEIFKYNGEWYQCIRLSDCPKCDLKIIKDCRLKFPCESLQREDCEEVIFKKLEKVGEPFACNIHGDERLVWMQEYKLHDVNFCKENALLMYVSDYKHKRIAIEIK